MEIRDIKVSLEKAQEWYQSGNKTLKEVALQAFTEKELTTPNFANIKTFDDACKALNISNIRLNLSFTGYGHGEYEHLVAINKLNIIRRALNQGWEPKITEGDIYFPCVRIYPASDAEKAAKNRNWVVKESFTADGNKCSLVGGDCCGYYNDGMSIYNFGHGTIIANLSLFACKSKEIAQHMSSYFAKEIFEASYTQHVGSYQWVD